MLISVPGSSFKKKKSASGSLDLTLQGAASLCHIVHRLSDAARRALCQQRLFALWFKFVCVGDWQRLCGREEESDDWAVSQGGFYINRSPLTY